MVNKEIARQFSLLASLLELHGENAFKTKAYSNAYLILRKWDIPLSTMSPSEIGAIPGIGSSVISKINELLSTGQMDALEKLKAKTPEGIQQLLSIKGLGPKKIRTICDALQIESAAELLYACNENRLVKLPGFGYKTQEDLSQKIRYYLESEHKYLFANIEEDLAEAIRSLREAFPLHRFEWAGSFATFSPVVERIECVVSPLIDADQFSLISQIKLERVSESGSIELLWDERLRISVYAVPASAFMNTWIQHTWDKGLYEKTDAQQQASVFGHPSEILAHTHFKGLPAELWDKPGIEMASPSYWEDLINVEDIEGILHNHSDWSDGIHTLEEMAVFVQAQGFKYFAICDHSRSAFYANGLSAEKVVEQMNEIDRLNQRMAPFRIFKGIESDILGDGSLDYEPEILALFDLIVASIHSNLRMDESRAMSRLIKAIENPYTRILGHPTGRLLLSRQGYPIDHRKVIDACAANGVAIELNANPLRLDIDYTWMDYCMEKEVWVSINPDAHSRGQVEYVRYGVLAARKGGLRKASCLNALPPDRFEQWLKRK